MRVPKENSKSPGLPAPANFEPCGLCHLSPPAAAVVHLSCSVPHRVQALEAALFSASYRWQHLLVFLSSTQSTAGRPQVANSIKYITLSLPLLLCCHTHTHIYIYIYIYIYISESSIEGDVTVPASSNFAASHYES